MPFKHKNGLRYFQFDLFNEQNIFHAFLTRHGGYSKSPFNSLNTGGTVGDDPADVINNHQKIYQEFGYDFSSRFDVWQVHGKDVICSDAPRPPDSPHKKADGILTNNPKVTLFMQFADCVPILLYDYQNAVIGIVHAGWQGTALNVAQTAINQMKRCYGTDPQFILAGIGPSICQSCYEVGDDVFSAFIKNIGERANEYFISKNGRYMLDLWKANKDLLEGTGVTQIEVAGLCTSCHVEDWFSHRGEHGNTGRFGVLMAIKDN